VTIIGEDPGRLSPPIESAAYFCVAEGVTNAIKHAVPARVTIELCRAPGVMTVTVTDDGPGGPTPPAAACVASPTGSPR
jgi:signal transduction histidine kinase